jgi:hypothetical protein
MVLSIEGSGPEGPRKLALMYGSSAAASMHRVKLLSLFYNGLLFWYFDTIS